MYIENIYNMQKLLFCFSLLLFVNLFYTQNKNLTLADADDLLIKNNLSLFAARYEVDMAEANKIQARLFDNPDISFQVPAYSKDKGWFDLNGDYELTLQQAIKIAGKKKSGVNLAESQKKLANWQYELLVKQLIYAVHNSYFTIYYLQQSINKTSVEIEKIKTIIDALQVQYKKGNVTLNEVIRMTATYNSLSSDVLELQNSISGEQNNLRTLLLIKPEYELTPTPTTTELNKYSLKLINLNDAIDKSMAQHPEIKIAEAEIYMNQMQLKYEKKQVIPDLQIGIGFSKNGEYVKNETLANIGFSIPIFNRNQGNIKNAEYKIKQSEIEKKNQENIISNQIKLSFEKIKALENRYSHLDPEFEKQFDFLMTSVSDNYMKRNLSLLEFTDLIETYHEQIIQLNNLKLQKLLAYEELNYNTGYAIFNNNVIKPIN